MSISKKRFLGKQFMEITEPDKNHIVISVLGKDRPGIFYRVTRLLADFNGNIEDVRQSVLQGYVSITFLVNISRLNRPLKELEEKLQELAQNMAIDIRVLPHVQGYTPKLDKLYYLTIVGKDHVGILAGISKVLYNANVNIETIYVFSRKNYVVNHFLIDLTHLNLPLYQFRNKLREVCNQLNLSMVLQSETQFYRPKKLVVFDMDSTLIENEIINELAQERGVYDDVLAITEKTLRGEFDFKEALKKRVELLKGLSIEALDNVCRKIVFSPGAREVVSTLREMGYKIAVISSGFTYFTNYIKKQLNLDYAFGNELEIKNGRLTGRLVGPIISREEKLAIIKMIAQILSIKLDDVIAVGDGSNDSLMLEKTGLGIGYMAKPVAADVADGNVHSKSLLDILFALALPRERIEFLLEQKITKNL